MAITQNLGGVFTKDTDGNLASSVRVSTENVVGLVFDTKTIGGMTALASTSFANGNVVELNILKDCEDAGMTKTLYGGLPYYHIQQFFALAGSNQRLFVSFMDSTSDTDFEAIEKMQLASNGIIYQIGLWTGVALATVGETAYTVGETNLVTKLQSVAEKLGGKIGQTNYDGNSPVNILLNAPMVNAAECDYKKLPDLSSLNAPKVSVLLGQAAADSCHTVQLAVNALGSDDNYEIVGNIGAALACLAVAPADDSIAHVENYNLSAAIPEAELGFGNLTQSSGNWGTSVSFTNIKTLSYTKRNNYLHKKGYIFLTNYDGFEGGIYFSSDQTLSTGDYRTIARCRVMHKSRRIVRLALLPKANASVEVDTTTGYMSSSDISDYSDIVLNALDANMVQPGTSVSQISGRTCTIDEEQNILENDQLLINYSIIPKGTTSVISVTEGFASTAG